MPRKPSPEHIRATLQRLSLEQKQEIYAWLGETIASEEATEVDIPQHHKAAAVAQRHYEGRTYQLEKRRCNRFGCRCMDGDIAEVGHGPYWYRYWKEQGKLKNQYVGKRPPWTDLSVRSDCKDE